MHTLDGADLKLEPCIRLTCVDSFRLQSFISDSVSSSQFNKWLRDSKSRVLDIFRRMDHDRDGKLTREQFITGILNTSKRDIIFQPSVTYRFKQALSLFYSRDTFCSLG